MARLSIIVPCLNEAAVIVEGLCALALLRWQGAELILVDGGSSDMTSALAKPWVDRVLSAPPGRARQMNTGAGAARGDILLFLHADTRLPQNADDLITSALDSGRIWGRFDVEIHGRHAMLRVVARLMNLRSRLTGIATGDQAIFVSRRAFRAIGGYPDIPIMEDIALSRRLKSLGRPACLCERVTTSGRRWKRKACGVPSCSCGGCGFGTFSAPIRASSRPITRRRGDRGHLDGGQSGTNGPF